MSVCSSCSVPGHLPGACINAQVPMIARTCTCRHGVADSAPSPYWAERSGGTAEADTAKAGDAGVVA